MPFVRFPLHQVNRDFISASISCRGSRIDENMARQYSRMPAQTCPPLIAFQDGPDGPLHLGDGNHRLEAAARRGDSEILVEIRQGTRRDAILCAIQANHHHGLTRTHADKRSVVNRLLDDASYDGQSDEWFAQACQVSRSMVAGLRRIHPRHAQLASNPRRGLDGRVRKLPKAQAPDLTPKQQALAALARAKAQIHRAIDEAEQAERVLKNGATRQTIQSLKLALRELDIWQSDLEGRSPFPPMPDPNDLSDEGRTRSELYRISRMKESDMLDYARKMLSHDRAHLKSLEASGMSCEKQPGEFPPRQPAESAGAQPGEFGRDPTLPDEARP